MVFRLIELTFRSLSNILEHLHQSFFFYLLPNNEQLITISPFIALGIIPVVALAIAAIFDPWRLYFIRGFLALTLCSAINLLSLKSFVHYRGHSWSLLFLNAASVAALVIHLSPGQRFKVSSPGIRAVLCFVGGLVLIVSTFSNISLALLFGLIYAPLIMFPSQSIFRPILGLFLSPLTLFTLSYVTGSEWAHFISDKLIYWNHGLPALIWQPIMVLNVLIHEGPVEKHKQD